MTQLDVGAEKNEMGKIIGIIILVLTLAGVGLVWHSLTYENYGVEVDSVGWLPEEAKRITFFEDGLGNKTAEFEIEQSAFERWCKEIGRPLRTVKEGDSDVLVWRSLEQLERKGAIPPLDNAGLTLEELRERIARRRKELSPGDLYHSEVWRNSGGYRIGYDREEGMGYYSESRN